MGFRFFFQVCFCFVLIVGGFCTRKKLLESHPFGRGSSSVRGLHSKPGSGLRLGHGTPVVEFRAVSSPTSVTVLCNEADLEVTVNKDLFGTGHLVKEADLSLGSVGCTPTSVSDMTIVFRYELHECGSSLKMTLDSFVYSTSLYYTPTTSLVIIRTNDVVVPIHCYYPRKENVSSNAIHPTWVPFRSTVSSEQRMNFSLRLMNDDWSAQRDSTEFYLGDVLHIEASVSTENHVPLRLFIDSCVATLQEDETSTPKYPIIDNYGCFTDGRSSESSSTFIAPRIKDDKLRFDLLAFRFFKDSRNLIYITCHLKAVSTSQILDSTNKACSFTKNVWSAVEGFSSICRCCETGNCGNLPFRRLHKRNALKASQADVHLGPVVIKNPLAEGKSTFKEGHPILQKSYGSALEAMSFAILALGIVAFFAALVVYMKREALK